LLTITVVSGVPSRRRGKKKESICFDGDAESRAASSPDFSRRAREAPERHDTKRYVTKS
jgi:hypothetical protein